MKFQVQIEFFVRNYVLFFNFKLPLNFLMIPLKNITYVFSSQYSHPYLPLWPSSRKATVMGIRVEKRKRKHLKATHLQSAVEEMILNDFFSETWNSFDDLLKLICSFCGVLNEFQQGFQIIMTLNF